MTATPKLSFTVRKPAATDKDKVRISALPRHLSSATSSASATPLTGSPRTFSSREDSDDEESGIMFPDNGGHKDEPSSSGDEEEHLQDELITSFNKFGAKRVNGKNSKPKAPAGPLVIPSKPNPDWREAARKRRAAATRYIPDSARVGTGPDGSVGGLGTRDTINSGPQLSGLQFFSGVQPAKVDIAAANSTFTTGGDDDDGLPQIDDIPVPPNETDALQQDVALLPDVATAEDYIRVPITDFGAAMLRGMGWIDGGAVTSSERAKKNALVEPYLPKSRPTLLGIGAKVQEVLDDGSKKKKWKGNEKRYIPVHKRSRRDSK